MIKKLYVKPKAGRISKLTEAEIAVRNDPETLFTCTKCKVIKPNKDFYPRKSTDTVIRKFRAQCKDCEGSKRRIEMFENRFKHNEKRKKDFKLLSADEKRNKILKDKYGITLEDYNNLLEQQDNKCAICLSDNPKIRTATSFYIDHCHETLKVRGLLCQACNSALGLFEDKIENLQKAIEYLNKSRNEK